MKRNRSRPPALLVAAMAVLAALPPPARAQGGIDGVWHVGPVPEVRAVCHAGDSLWVGTGAGLFIIDIRDPSRMVRVDAGSRLPSNSVRAIAARGDSVLVGTDNGLSLFRGGSASVLPVHAPGGRGGVPTRLIQGISFGARGEIFLSTRHAGVGVLTPARTYSISRRDSLLDDNVFDVLDRHDRPRLFACAAGLCAQTDDTTFVYFQAGAGIGRGEVRQVVGDGSTAFLRVARRGVYRFDGMHAAQIDDPPGQSLADAASISLGADGALWAAGDGWVFVRRNSRWSRVSLPATDQDRRWRVVCADGAGAFIGSSDGVVLAVGRGTAFRAALGDGLPTPEVSSIRPDGRGAAWFVSGGRVVRADAAAKKVSAENSPLAAEAVEISPTGVVVAAGRWTVSRRGETGWTDLSPSVMENDPSFASVAIDPRENIWVGDRSGSLYKFDGEIWVRYAQARAGQGTLHDVHAFPEQAWAVLAGTPMRDNNGRWTRFAGWDSSMTIVDIAVNPAGEWFAATRSELLRYDAAAGSWRRAKDSVGVLRRVTAVPEGGVVPSVRSPAPITAIAIDATGRLFVGTEDGFGVVVGKGARWWTAGDGIGGARVTDLAADATTLWVGYAEDGFSAIPLAALK